MPISPDLMLAILSMDSYNRGYGAGLADGIHVDANGNDIDGLDEAGAQIGNATVLNIPLPRGAVAAGFHAVAYSWNGQTVISYRGTDNFFPGGNAGGFDLCALRTAAGTDVDNRVVGETGRSGRI